jgi:hypothetical protein
LPRWVYIVAAWVVAGISVALAARYGFKSADTATDGVIYATMFGTIAAGGGIMQALAVHVVAGASMRQGWRAFWGLAIGAIGLAAMLATVLSSLGAIAGRADAMAAERSKASETVKDDRADLARLATERAALKFTPTDAEAVAAARKAASTAERARRAECGDGDPKQRGKHCRTREDDEKDASDKLTAATTNKATTDRAAKLDADLAGIRKRLESAPTIGAVNPLAAALGRLFGMSVSDAADRRDLFLAIVLELLVAGSMIGVELTREHKAPEPSAPARRELPRGSVEQFLLAATKRKPRARTGWRDLHARYEAWCSGAATPHAFEAFTAELAAICRDIGVKVAGKGADAVCVDITLKG